MLLSKKRSLHSVINLIKAQRRAFLSESPRSAAVNNKRRFRRLFRVAVFVVIAVRRLRLVLTPSEIKQLQRVYRNAEGINSARKVQELLNEMGLSTAPRNLAEILHMVGYHEGHIMPFHMFRGVVEHKKREFLRIQSGKTSTDAFHALAAESDLLPIEDLKSKTAEFGVFLGTDIEKKAKPVQFEDYSVPCLTVDAFESFLEGETAASDPCEAQWNNPNWWRQPCDDQWWDNLGSWMQTAPKRKPPKPKKADQQSNLESFLSLRFQPSFSSQVEDRENEENRKRMELDIDALLDLQKFPLSKLAAPLSSSAPSRTPLALSATAPPHANLPPLSLIDSTKHSRVADSVIKEDKKPLNSRLEDEAPVVISADKQGLVSTKAVVRWGSFLRRMQGDIRQRSLKIERAASAPRHRQFEVPRIVNECFSAPFQRDPRWRATRRLTRTFTPIIERAPFDSRPQTAEPRSYRPATASAKSAAPTRPTTAQLATKVADNTIPPFAACLPVWTQGGKTLY